MVSMNRIWSAVKAPDWMKSAKAACAACTSSPRMLRTNLAQWHFTELLLKLFARSCGVLGEEDFLQSTQFSSCNGEVAGQLVDGEVMAVFTHVLLDAVLVRLEVEVTLAWVHGRQWRPCPTRPQTWCKRFPGTPIRGIESNHAWTLEAPPFEPH